MQGRYDVVAPWKAHIFSAKGTIGSNNSGYSAFTCQLEQQSTSAVLDQTATATVTEGCCKTDLELPKRYYSQRLR